MCMYIYITFLLIFSWYSYTRYVPEWPVVLVSLGMSVQIWSAAVIDCPVKLFEQSHRDTFLCSHWESECLSVDLRLITSVVSPPVIISVFSGFYFLGWQWRVTVQGLLFLCVSVINGALYTIWCRGVAMCAPSEPQTASWEPLCGQPAGRVLPGALLAGRTAQASWKLVAARSTEMRFSLHSAEEGVGRPSEDAASETSHLGPDWFLSSTDHQYCMGLLMRWCQFDHSI